MIPTRSILVRASTLGALLLLLAVATGAPAQAGRAPVQRPPLAAPETSDETPLELLGAALERLLEIVDPAPGERAPLLSARLVLERAEGLPSELADARVELDVRAPDRLRLAARVKGDDYAIGLGADALWMHAVEPGFALRGVPGLPRFAARPDALDDATFPELRLAQARALAPLLPLCFAVTAGEPETVDGERCHVLTLEPTALGRKRLGLGAARIRLWLRERDLLPARIAVAAKGIDAVLALRDLRVEDELDEELFALPAGAGTKIETVPLGHLLRFFGAALSIATVELPPLGPATGTRRVLAREGRGRLEEIDGTMVLFLAGTPEEMGHQHGVLLRDEVRTLVERMLYGVGVASSFPKERWFFGEIEEAERRLQPHMDERYLREMDALADAAGLAREEVRLANYFPELFHCTGFALFGDATADGALYHGRVLDYMKGVGLEETAVVMVVRPDEGNAWVNVGYAGFVGSVTAMNEERIAIGEMGGRGEGRWDGKPMAQLVREVMERADTLDEAVEILRRGPRTCEYYYVVSDAKTMRAVGVRATPDEFETVAAGASHALLPDPVEDTVLLSAGDRYEELVRRVRAGHGRFDAAAARDLMTRPVCMKSNIQSVLFAPATLELWVAHADGENVASHARYTHYDLDELLAPSAAQAQAGGE